MKHKTFETALDQMIAVAAIESLKMRERSGLTNHRGPANLLKQAIKRRDTRLAMVRKAMIDGNPKTSQQTVDALALSRSSAHGYMKEAVEHGVITRTAGPKVNGGKSFLYQLVANDG
jgi:predicted transcriptional regulator